MQPSGQAQHIVVGIADVTVVKDQDVFLCSPSLGAGIAVGVHDPAAKVGGLVHCLLPQSADDPPRAAARPGLFLNTGLAELVRQAADLGAKWENLLVYAAGGGRILDESTIFDLGRRNHEALLRWLAENGLPLAAADVGGLVNRVLLLNPATGEVRLKVSGEAKLKILCKPLKIT